MSESSSTSTPTPTFVQSLVAGGAAGLAVDILFFPIDTIKTRLQSSQGFARAGGFRGIYKGLGSVAVGSAPGGKIMSLENNIMTRLMCFV
jgi:solute carrier family 25 (mitochondrial S-adenosylmethionine transporter), member 26